MTSATNTQNKNEGLHFSIIVNEMYSGYFLFLEVATLEVVTGGAYMVWDMRLM